MAVSTSDPNLSGKKKIKLKRVPQALKAVVVAGSPSSAVVQKKTKKPKAAPTKAPEPKPDQLSALVAKRAKAKTKAKALADEPPPARTATKVVHAAAPAKLVRTKKAAETMPHSGAFSDENNKWLQPKKASTRDLFADEEEDEDDKSGAGGNFDDDDDEDDLDMADDEVFPGEGRANGLEEEGEEADDEDDEDEDDDLGDETDFERKARQTVAKLEREAREKAPGLQMS